MANCTLSFDYLAYLQRHLDDLTDCVHVTEAELDADAKDGFDYRRALDDDGGVFILPMDAPYTPTSISIDIGDTDSDGTFIPCDPLAPKPKLRETLRQALSALALSPADITHLQTNLPSLINRLLELSRKQATPYVTAYAWVNPETGRTRLTSSQPDSPSLPLNVTVTDRDAVSQQVKQQLKRANLRAYREDLNLYVLIKDATGELAESSFDRQTLVDFVLNDVGYDRISDYGHIDTVPVDPTELKIITNPDN